MCDKNVDRVKFYKLNENNYHLSACYHLDKNTGEKTGMLYNHSFNLDNNEFELLGKFSYNYGILDFLFTKDAKVITANSDSSWSIFDLSNPSIELIKNNKIEMTQKENTCNTVAISETNNIVLGGMNSGEHHLWDISKDEYLYGLKSHEYGLWSSLFIDENSYLTGSEDSLMKLWDLRESKWYYIIIYE
jgi:WD40 repeat protein